ncbi:RPEL repeat-containing protein [Aspergillus clavatus NRRL 1]|uniref:RPEL repeat protein n=1 Tax=Aspergillus clavatus (strain ATCC 1007 / CBS 513.65 / DSM 816 / NCTC 3887 / NRRL 1 / QM 1276 / 107) TaxID=344612 RepID=A1CGA6_ASPCL|nr:RPEL repeat protein [Aspergillus clavatus NRRL 1]EAW10986.1 RPEL repeat protein [Aspergillus clavatus NRRL 1]
MDNMILNAEIDESPLSTTSMDRRNSLEKHLQTRPDAQDLKERHILLDTTVAPSLQARGQELARQRTTDSLKRHLEHRPERDELVERNILPHINAAPALQAHAKELEKHMRADTLDQRLQQRPQPEELITQGILTEDEDPRFPAV